MEFLGTALAGRRDRAVIATKWGHTVSLADGERGGSPEQIRKRLEASLTRLGTEYLAPYPSIQNHDSVLTRDPETNGVLAPCAELGISFVPYFPLESGLLTGKYHAGEDRPAGSEIIAWGDRAEAFIDDRMLRIVERLMEWTAERGHGLVDLGNSWHTSHPLVASVIAGATRPQQIADNVTAAT